MMHALKACISSPLAHSDPDRQFRLWAGLLRDNEDFAAGLAEIGPLFLPPGAKPDEEPEWKQERLVMHAETQNAAFSENMPRYDVRDQLKDIKVPTLVIVGRHDLITPVEESVVLAEGIEGARLVVFEHSGHHPGNDEPVAFRECVSDFLETIGKE
jgi:proline iminopeptidase